MPSIGLRNCGFRMCLIQMAHILEPLRLIHARLLVISINVTLVSILSFVQKQIFL